MQSSSINRIKQTTQRGLCAGLLIAALAVGINGPAQATLLNLIPETPDIFSGFMNIGYNAGSGLFAAQGFANALNVDGVSPLEPIAGGLFNLLNYFFLARIV